MSQSQVKVYLALSSEICKIRLEIYHKLCHTVTKVNDCSFYDVGDDWILHIDIHDSNLVYEEAAWVIHILLWCIAYVMNGSYRFTKMIKY